MDYDICKAIDEYAERDKRAKMQFDAETKYKKLAESFAEYKKENDPQAVILAMQESADEVIDGFVDYVLSGPASRFFESVAVDVSEEDMDVAKEYLALMTIKDNKKEFNRILDKYFKEEFNRNSDLSKAGQHSRSFIEGQIRKLLNDEIESKLSTARNALIASKASIVDSQDVFDEINAWRAKYDEAKDAPDTVLVYRDGKPVLVQTDPNLAALVNNSFVDSTRLNGVLGFIGNKMIALNRLARNSQTVVNPSSIKNQWIRDPLDGYVLGATYDLFGKISKQTQAMFGQEMIDYVRTTSPEDWKAIQEIAQREGVSVESKAYELILQRELINTTTYTRTLREPLDTKETASSKRFWGTQIQKTKRGLSNIYEKLNDKIEKTVHDPRELGVRKRVAQNTMHQYLVSGHTVEEAMTAAQWSASNATINYGRLLTHTENLRRTVNYYGAAVNGFKSFWRMFELDPVGITTRLFAGIILPIIAMTVYSLATERDRKVYQAMKEYEKDNNLVVVIDGVIYKIPIPQEMNSIASMARHSVESVFGANKHDFWELAMNDLLGIGPIDFSDIMDIDMNRFAEEPDFLDRLGGLGLSMVNQLAPVAVKSIIEAAFNIDTYTGRPIDTSYREFDDEGNLIVVNPNSTGKFAKDIGELTGWSAPIIAHTLKNVLGQVGTDIIDTIAGGQSPLKLLENGAEDLLSFEGSNYDKIAQDWTSNIAALYREKDALLTEYNMYNAEINKTADPDKQNKLRTDRQNLIDPFLKKVQTAVQNLKKEHPGSYDRFRFASVVSLITFDTGTTTGDTAEQRANSLNNYYENLERTYQWMDKLGIDSTDTSSILGYYMRNKNTGEITVKYNTPTGILAAREAYYGKGERNTAEIEMLFKNAKVKKSDKYGSGYDEAKAEGKTALKEYKSEWNARAVKAVAPYIKNLGVDNVLANDAVRDLLNDYLFIDNQYQIKAYLKKIFENA